MANFYRSWVCMISAVICMLPRWVWHLCNWSCVIYALFKLISIARYAFKSPWVTFEETKHEIHREHVAYLHSILWCWARSWLKLFANIVGRLLLQITSLSSEGFLCMVFPEWSQTMAQYNTRNSQQTRTKTATFESCGERTDKRGRNLTLSKRNISSIR